MAKHIQLITAPITTYLSQRFGHALRGNKGANDNTLPPHLEWARLRGEALLVKRFFGHFAATIFPAESRRDDVNKLKREIRKKLAQLWNIRPEIRESFTENEDGIIFSLIARISGSAPCPLLTLNGKRLKPTRLKACQSVLAQLENGTLELEVPHKPRNLSWKHPHGASS